MIIDIGLLNSFSMIGLNLGNKMKIFDKFYIYFIFEDSLSIAKEAKNIPDWCPLPDVEENKIAELLRGYFRWHDEMGFISHKDGDIDEYVSSISK